MKIDTKNIRKNNPMTLFQGGAQLLIERCCDRIDELESVIKNLEIEDHCWCECAIGNPMYHTHSKPCIAAQAAMREV